MADDFSANPGTTGAFDVNGEASGSIETAGDVDWFAITLGAGEAIELTGPAWLAGILFYDALGNPVEVDFFRVVDEGDGAQSAGFTATAAGTYYVAAVGGAATGNYTLTAEPAGAHGADAGPARLQLRRRPKPHLVLVRRQHPLRPRPGRSERRHRVWVRFTRPDRA